MLNPDPSIGNPRIESPVVIKTARPHTPNPGFVYPYPFGDIASGPSNVQNVFGANDAIADVVYYDPTRVDDHTYSIRFHREFHVVENATWDFIDRSEFHTGVAVGGDEPSDGTGPIEYSNDGGVSWAPQSSGTIQTLNSVAMSDIFTGFAVGDAGTILRTTDRGEHWTQQLSGISMPLYGI